MQLNITFRNLDASESLKEYAREKVERVNKYLDRAGEAHVVLSLERHIHYADITIYSGRYVLRGTGDTPDMYASLDAAMDKIEKQLIRYKEKLKNHHGRDRAHHRRDLLESALKVRHNVISLPESPDADAPPEVIKSDELVASPMTVDEAVMQMDLMNNDFLVFTNSASNQMNVVYRRKDGHYGVLDATQSPDLAAVSGK